ncbi:sugar phosphate nucleotidyltransferase [Metabacillus sp. B2-18]|uniref:sugar phosphate nucleotidyltransferase n=1 Tax=Metabacillus sp. B2-18 TaxID=2897333 RepID=UPI001E2C7D63|nr:sugar phosphate nucleotidyltransferase [Metabacillus sp. B2-18]UGB28716.1 NTP transferase domain-containing protein [Metabacillus sp. B2-18]
MKVVILCGGKGLRMRGLEENIPKALARVNGKPIIWHIMKLYSQYGYNEFILPLGYQGEKIKEYFIEYKWKESDLELVLNENNPIPLNNIEDWSITFADTGLETMTGARIKNIEKYVDDDIFLLTYGDGLSDINIDKLIQFHKEKGKTVTLTGIRKQSQYGILELENGIATKFVEKPEMNSIINGGFFVCNRDFFRYLSDDPQCVLEENPLKNLIKDEELAIYEHDGLWMSIDTPKDLVEANKIWKS